MLNPKKLFLLAASLAFGFAMQAKTVGNLPERGANVPYVRYDSKDAKKGGKATREKARNFDFHKTASEASNQEYIALHTPDDYISWKVESGGNGVTIRFTLPDNASGESVGQRSDISVFLNGKCVKTVTLDSRWAWQYFVMNESNPLPDITDMPLMRFDEVHFLLPPYSIKSGDELTIRKASDDGLDCGIDFVEIEPVGPPIGQSKYAVSVTSFGAVGDGVHDDMPAFRDCIKFAVENNRSIYIPPGTFALDSLLCLFDDNIYITGAGMWYTNLYFTNNGIMKGGICGNASNLHVSGLYINGVNTLRQERNGDYRDYKAIWGNFGENSTISDIWSEHFECGIWIAGYYPPVKPPTQNLRVSNCRLRNHYADGVNFAEGTSNSIFENSDIRNCGDDGIASWSQTHKTKQCNQHNIFRNCTVELGWRAGGIGMFGGGGHEIYNCYVGEMLMSAGIRFTADFPGCPLDGSNPMKVSNCTVYKCGTTKDLFHNRLGSLEVHGSSLYPLDNIQFSDIDVVRSQTDGVQLWGGNIHNASFRNVNIVKTGKGFKFQKKMQKPYGIATHDDGSATFENVRMSGTKKYDKKQKTFQVEMK